MEVIERLMNMNWSFIILFAVTIALAGILKDKIIKEKRKVDQRMHEDTERND